MKIFLGTPITGIIDETSVSHISNHNYKALTRIMSDLRGLGHDIFCALEDEKYGAQIADSDSCTLRDFTRMKACDVYVVFPNESYGCAVELGWASALSKPIYIGINKKIGTKSPLYDGLSTINATVKIMEYESDCAFPVDDIWEEILDSINVFLETI